VTEARLLRGWSVGAGAPQQGRERFVHELIEEQAERTPDAVAVA